MAMARVTAASAAAAEPLFEAAYAHIQAAVEHMSAEEASKEIKPMKPTVRGPRRAACLAGGRLACLLCVCVVPPRRNGDSARGPAHTPAAAALARPPQAEQDPSDPEGQTTVKQSLIINVSRCAPGPGRGCRDLALGLVLVQQQLAAAPCAQLMPAATTASLKHMLPPTPPPPPLPAPAARQRQVRALDPARGGRPGVEAAGGGGGGQVPRSGCAGLFGAGAAGERHASGQPWPLRAAGRPWPSPPPLTCPRAPPAGAHPTDIRNALKGHPLADQMEDLIGPEPEPEAAVVAAEAAAAAVRRRRRPRGCPPWRGRRRQPRECRVSLSPQR